MRDEKEERKKEASKVKQTNKAKQHSTPKAVTFIHTNTHVTYPLHAVLEEGAEYECASVLHHHTQDVKKVVWHPNQEVGGFRLYTCIPVYLYTCIPVYMYTCIPVYMYACSF